MPRSFATTIDFGQLTFETDLDRILQEAGVDTLVRCVGCIDALSVCAHGALDPTQ